MTEALVGGLLVAVGGSIGVLVWLETRRRRHDAVLIGLLSSFGPAVVEGKSDPERLVAWAEVTETARALFPEAFAQLDTAAGGRFPFSAELIDAAHARWTADWLAWERQHDLEYRQRTTEAESLSDAAGASSGNHLRERVAAITQEKLQTYQERYEHYVRVGKAIATLTQKAEH